MRRSDPMVSFCSGPFWPDTLSVRETGTVELLREAAKRIAKHPAVTGGAPQLRSALAEIALKSSFNRPAWSPSVGQVYAALGDPERDRAVAAAVNLILDFIEGASPFSCVLEFDSPQTLISDPLILPESTHLTISWQAPKLALATKDSTFEFSQCLPEGSTASAGPRVAPAGCFEAVGGVGVLNGAGVDIFPSLGAVPATIDFGEASSSIADALELLRQCAPEYVDWILPMVRWAIPVSAPPGEFASGSGFHSPGVVAVSLPSDALTLAESFVHETAHQYLFLASRFARLTDADEGRLYYSPLAGRDRPLEMILAAFHAAANIASFFSLVADRRPDLAASEASTLRVTADCRLLADHLVNNSHITDSGLSLFEPIYHWLTDRRLV